MKMDFTPVYKHKTLNGIGGEIREDLGSVFNFGDSKFSIYSVGTERGKREFRKVYSSAGGYTSKEIEQELQKFRPGGCRAQTHYIRGLVEGEKDYVVFVASEDIESILPKVLGEELTHGEHMVEHLDKPLFMENWIKGYDDYFQRFPMTVVEFIGDLGYRYIGQRFPEGRLDCDDFENDIPPVCIDDLDYEAAKQVSRQIIENNGYLSCPEIFRATRAEEVWDIVNGILVPVVEFKYSPYCLEANAAPELLKSLEKRFRKSGLKIDTNLSKN